MLRYELPGDAEVDLKIFSCLGQEVKALDGGPKQAGVHEVHWDGRDREGHAAGSGMYLARLVTGQTGAVIKMVLLR